MVNLDINEYRHQIAVVPQNTILFSGTILDNIAYGLEHVTEKEVMEVIKDDRTGGYDRKASGWHLYAAGRTRG